MKKTTKLMLAKETVRSLETSAISDVVAGATLYNSCWRICLEEPITYSCEHSCSC